MFAGSLGLFSKAIEEFCPEVLWPGSQGESVCHWGGAQKLRELGSFSLAPQFKWDGSQ